MKRGEENQAVVKRRHEFRERCRKRLCSDEGNVKLTPVQPKKMSHQMGGMTGNDTNHPGVDPQSILPTETWVNVLRKLSAENLVRCRQVCLLWEAILKPNQCDWMFAQVIPHVFQYLDQADVLNCRLVTKQWTNAIDTFLENNTEMRPYTFETHQQDKLRGCGWSPYGYTRLDDGYFFLDCFHIERFLDTVQEHAVLGTNPFVGRYVVFGVCEEDEFIDHYWNSVIKLLGTFGKHVWYMNIGDDSGRQTPPTFYRLLRECLSRLPNLRSLEIEGYLETNYTLPELRDVICEMKLPSLPLLDSIEIRLENSPPLIQGIILEHYGKQLKKAAVYYDVCCRDIASFPYGLESLTEMLIKRVDSNRMLDKLVRVKSRLQKLTLDLRSDAWRGQDFRNERWDVRRLLTVLKHFPLRFLKIYLDPLAHLGPIRRPAKMFTSCLITTLQTLEFENTPNVSYNFLLRMPNLEFLHIAESLWKAEVSSEIPVKYKSTEIVDIHKYMYDSTMYNSNVWKILGKLQVFSYVSFLVPRYICHRETYEQYVKRSG